MNKAYFPVLGFIIIGFIFLLMFIDKNNRSSEIEINANIKKYECTEVRNQNYSREIILNNNRRYYSINKYACMYDDFQKIMHDNLVVSL